MDIPVEKKFKILCEITRASHFAWRQAVIEACPDVDIKDVVYKMWEITGHETAKAYINKIDSSKPVLPQIARSFVWSSVTMGEDAEIVDEGNPDEIFVRHNGCPWFNWHMKVKALPEDKPGCDIWFKTVISDINKAFGTNVKIETQSSLPDGESSCVRRIWLED